MMLTHCMPKAICICLTDYWYNRHNILLPSCLFMFSTPKVWEQLSTCAAGQSTAILYYSFRVDSYDTC